MIRIQLLAILGFLIHKFVYMQKKHKKTLFLVLKLIMKIIGNIFSSPIRFFYKKIKNGFSFVKKTKYFLLFFKIAFYSSIHSLVLNEYLHLITGFECRFYISYALFLL
ncbi:hypothetical protein EDEG_00565 [Edhazardia aedis USNM 41457]|uniref:Uncharacterized protein n=1 Tax=Edhazardia aedis (strain USNM 41457) TaxID=1003232 RepID=J9DF36_EDHAE|nr:hypothetical protein EDEG_00565 [Edhazardia aedis USNM 41457]|eukprot:EJW01205.1 hypothetical protein EDEG_00565 [Edhazardia aedis USNM 41457]